MASIELNISQLVEYAVQKNLIAEADRLWAANRLLEVLRLDGFGGLVPVEEPAPAAPAEAGSTAAVITRETDPTKVPVGGRPPSPA